MTTTILTRSSIVFMAGAVVGFLLATAGCETRGPDVSAVPTPSLSPTPGLAQSPIPIVVTPSAMPAATPTQAATASEIAPDFSLPQTDESVFALSEHLGQGPVVVVFLHHVGG